MEEIRAIILYQYKCLVIIVIVVAILGGSGVNDGYYTSLVN